MELALLVYAISVVDHLRDMIFPALIIAAAIAIGAGLASADGLGVYPWLRVCSSD